MGFLRSLLRLYSFLFHGLFALFLFGLAVVALLSRADSFWFEILPWSGKSLACWLLGIAAVGILLVILAFRGALRGLYFLWNLVVLALILRGFFFSDYSFRPGTGQLRNALLIVLAAVLAVVGAKVAGRKKNAGRLA